MSNRQNILEFLRSKPRGDVEEYARANNIDPVGVSTDTLDQSVADVLNKKYNRWANQYGSGVIANNQDCRGDGECSGALSPRTRKFTKGANLGFNTKTTSPRRSIAARGAQSQNLGVKASQNLGVKASQNLGVKASQNLGGSKRRVTEKLNQTGMNRWANQYGSGVIPDAKDARGESAASIRWQQQMKDQGMGGGLSAAEAAVMARKARTLSPRRSQNLAGLSPRGQNVGQNSNAKKKGTRSNAKRNGTNVGNQNLGGQNLGGISPRRRTVTGQYQIVGGQNLGGQVNLTDVSGEINLLAQQIVGNISGGNMLQDLSQYTEAVRALAGTRLGNGSGVSAVQATKALDPYYVGATQNSNAKSPRTRANAKKNGNNGTGAKKGIYNLWANQYGSGFIANDQDCRGDGQCSGKGQNLGSPRSQNISGQNLGQNLGAQRGTRANNWLKAVKACTNATDLNGPECAVALDELYQGPFERKEGGEFRDAVLASAQTKLNASGQNLSLVMQDAGVNLGGSQNVGTGRAQNLGRTQNANGRKNGTNGGGQNLGVQRGARARQWLNQIKKCTDQTNLDAVGCAIALGDQQLLGKQNLGSPRAQNTNGQKR